jgi:hypothetical protein
MRCTLGLCLLVFPASANFTHDKYLSFFPHYNSELMEALNGPCRSNYTAYLANQEFNPVECGFVYGCLISNSVEIQKGDFASANVLLGLLPGVLSLASSSVGEISMLSSHRPLLSFLLSMGAPAVYQWRSFQYEYPPSSLPKRPSFWTAEKRGRKWWILISLMQYILALLSVANVMTTSWQLGFNTVMTWKCNSNYFPFL